MWDVHIMTPYIIWKKELDIQDLYKSSALRTRGRRDRTEPKLEPKWLRIKTTLDLGLPSEHTGRFIEIETMLNIVSI